MAWAELWRSYVHIYITHMNHRHLNDVLYFSLTHAWLSMIICFDCAVWSKRRTSIKLVWLLSLSKDSTMHHLTAVSRKHKGTLSEMEGALTNGFAMKKAKWKYRDLNFLQWKAPSNHLATDMDFPRRVSAYRANSCYANGTENNVLNSEHYLLQGSIRFLFPCVHINIRAVELSVLWAHRLDWFPLFFFLLQGVFHWKI